jgi:hypothetical protein
VVVFQQYWPAEQVVVAPWMQPCTLEQVSSVASAMQLLPVALPHPLVGGGQLQPATPPLTEQTRPVAAQLVSASCRQPIALVQVTRAEPLLQEVPAVGQFGTLGQTQVPLGKLPEQTMPVGQDAVAAEKHPLPSWVQVTSSPPLQ